MRGFAVGARKTLRGGGAMNIELTIRTAQASDLPAALAWLAGAGLPTEDLVAEKLQGFLVALANDVPIGMVGIEEFGRCGLLRSLVVEPTVRSAGVGRVLVTALESRAIDRGISELWLLTIDADPYFVGLGYEEMDRSDAPEPIRNTEEFASLCPGDAVLMRKQL